MPKAASAVHRRVQSTSTTRRATTDYLGLAQELKQALATYTESGGTGRTALDQDEAAVAVMLEKHDVCCGLFYGFDWSKWTTGTPTERLGLLPAAQEHILAQESGKETSLRSTTHWKPTTAP